MQLKENDPDAYDKFMRVKGKQKFIFATGMYEGDLSSGASIVDGSALRKAPEGIPIYDISSGKFLVRNGNKVTEYISQIKEE